MKELIPRVATSLIFLLKSHLKLGCNFVVSVKPCDYYIILIPCETCYSWITFFGRKQLPKYRHFFNIMLPET